MQRPVKNLSHSYSLVFCRRFSIFSLYYKKSNVHYARGMTQKRATSGGAHLRGSAPEQHSSEETSLKKNRR